MLVVDRRFYGEMLVQDKVSLRLEEGAVETQKGSVSCLFRFRGSGKFRHFESVRFWKEIWGLFSGVNSASISFEISALQFSCSPCTWYVRLVQKEYKSIRSSLSAILLVQVRITVFSKSVLEPVVLKLKTYLVILSLRASLSLQPFRWASLHFAATHKYPKRPSMQIPLDRQNYIKCHSSWYPWTFLV